MLKWISERARGAMIAVKAAGASSVVWTIALVEGFRVSTR